MTGAELAAYLPVVLVAIAALLLAVVVALGRMARKARQSGPPDPESEELSEDGGLVFVDLRAGDASSPLEQSFDRAEGLLRRARRGSGGGYQAPWFLTLGQTWTGKTTLLGHSRLPLPFGEPRGALGLEPESGVNWWLFEHAVVLDVPGSYVLRLDGATSDEESWLDLLRLLERTHGRRPIDGVVLTIPADELYDPEKSASEVENDVARRTGALYGKLLQAQLLLGMRVPVDVLVTKCDLIPGFDAFTDVLTAGSRQQMFGWSNPYALDAPYQDSWVGQAFASIAQSLERFQGEALSSGVAIADLPGFYLFPQNLAKLESPLQIASNQLFAKTAYGEPLYFRGLYFCGGRFAEEAAEGDLCAAGPQEVLFLRDLFEDKVFAEDAVAQPTEAATSSAHRRRFWLQAALVATLVLGGLGLGHAYRSTSADADALEPLVETLEADFRALDRPGDRPDLGEMTRGLLSGSRGVERYELYSLMLPASWWSRLNPRIHRLFVRGYGRIVLPGAREGLDARVRALERTPTTPLPRHPPRTEPLAETPEFERLDGFVSGVSELESAARSYTCIGQSCAGRSRLVDELDHLTRYLYDATLSVPTSEARRFYGGVLHDVEAPPFLYQASDAVQLQGITRRLTDQVYDEVFANNAVDLALQELEREIEALESPIGAASADPEAYRRLDAQIEKVRDLLADPQYAWMTAKTVDLGEAMNRVYAEVAASRYLGPELSQELQAEAQARLEALQKRLAGYRTAATGPLLATQNGRVELQLSQGVEDLETALETYLAQSFLQPSTPATLTVPEEWQRLTWTVSLLNEAVGLVSDYDDYVKKDLAEFPADMRAEAEEIALESLEQNVLDLLAAAENLGVAPSGAPPSVLEQSLATRVQNFQQATTPLNALLQDFIRLGLGQAYWELASVLDRQELHLLQDDSTLLAQKDLYSPRGGDFGWWDGVEPPSPEGFGASTQKELASYLKNELDIVTRLAQTYAEPVIQQIATQVATSDRDPKLEEAYEEWSTILADLEAYKDKQAGNPVTSLQDYISEDLTAVTLANCFVAAPNPTPGLLVDDYFAERQIELEAELLSRCEQLSEEQGYGCYLQAERVFNERLADRFPFSTTGPGPGRAEATPEALTNFFTLYDQAAARLANVPAGRKIFGDEEEKVRDFVAEMAPVRAFLAPFLDDPKKYPVPTYSFTTDFRVNETKEVGADEVIGWELTVGEKTFTREDTDPDLSGAWKYGDQPVVLELRWAENAPSAPSQDAAGPAVRVEERSVIYEYVDPWSLVALMKAHDARPQDFPDFVDPEPETLKFVVPTRPTAEADQAPPAPSPAVLYNRVSLLTPDKSEPIVFPEAFPTEAPAVPPKRGWTECPALELGTDTDGGSASKASTTAGGNGESGSGSG